MQLLFMFFWLGIVPFCIGILPATLVKKEYRSVGLIYVLGFVMDVSVFQVLYLIFLLRSVSFFILWPFFGVASVLLAIISVIVGYDIFTTFKIKLPNWGFFIFAAIVLFQFVMRFRNGVTDGDDAFYLSTAVTTFYSGTMYKIDGYTGNLVKNLSDMRHALAGSPVYLAAVAKLSGCHPTMLAHTGFALQILSVHYIIVWEIGKLILDKNKAMLPFFAAFIAVFNIYGNVSLFTTQTFLLTRTWQGKAIFANVFIPMVFLMLLLIGYGCEEKKNRYGAFFILSIMMFASSLMTTSAVLMLPVLLMIGSAILGIVKRKLYIPFCSAISCIPLGVVGLIYLMKR